MSNPCLEATAKLGGCSHPPLSHPFIVVFEISSSWPTLPVLNALKTPHGSTAGRLHFMKLYIALSNVARPTLPLL